MRQRSFQLAGRTPTALVAPGQRLAPLPVTHGRDAAVIVGIGLIGSGWLQVTGRGWWVTLVAAVAAIGLAVVVVVAGRRKARRDRVRDLLVESLAPQISAGRDLDRRLVRLVGSTLPPAKVVVRYNPAAADDQINWLPTITSMLSRRLDQPYRLDKHDRGRCQLTFAPDNATAEEDPARSRIDRALKTLIGPSVVITGFDTLADGVVGKVSVSHGEPAKAAVDGFRNRVQNTVGKMLPGRWRAQWDLTGDTVVFEQRPNMPTMVWLAPDDAAGVGELVQSNYRQVRIPFGVTEDGDQVSWSPAVLPHLLMTGTTGSGKTSTVHNIVGTVTRWGWPVWILDGKRIEFLEFRTWPNVQIVAGEVSEQVALIRQVARLVGRRYELIESGQAKAVDFEPLLVVLDEYSEFVSTLTEWYPTVKLKSDPTRPPSLREVASIVRTARVARVHLLVTMQRPDVSLFGDRAGGEVRSNFGQRVSMGRLDLQGAMMLWGSPHIGVTVPRSVTGRATAINDQGVPTETQCYRFPALDAEQGSEQYERLQLLKPTGAAVLGPDGKVRNPRLLVVPPDASLDLDTSEPESLGFEDYASAEWALADDRPELDRVRLAEQGRVDDPDWARVASSPLASLGLHGDPRITARQWRGAGAGLGVTVSDVVDVGDVDPEFGYGAQTVADSPFELDIGDQVFVDGPVDDGADESSAVWVTVDEVPEPDPSDPSMVLVSWRSDDDGCGVLLLPGDEPVTVRKAIGWDRSNDDDGSVDVSGDGAW